MSVVKGGHRWALKHLPQTLYSQEVVFNSDLTYGNVARLFKENLSQDLQPTSWDTRSGLLFLQFSMVSLMVPSHRTSPHPSCSSSYDA